MIDVTAALPRVAAENIRVSRDEFGTAWARAEQIMDDSTENDYYLTGVVTAFRWLAGRTPRTPATRDVAMALPETIGVELMAARTRSTAPGHHPTRVDLARGAAAVLGWAFDREPLPLILR